MSANESWGAKFEWDVDELTSDPTDTSDPFYETEAVSEYQRMLDEIRDFRILDLPFEIREIIIEYIFDREAISVFLRGPYGPRPVQIPLPALAQAGDRMLRLEVIRVALMRLEIEIHSGPGNRKLQAYLESVDFTPLGGKNLKNGFDAITSLSFPYFSRFPMSLRMSPDKPNLDIELMLRCKNLQNVRLHFVKVVCFYDDDDGFAEYTSDELRSQFRLDRMLEMKHLRTLEFFGYCSYSADTGTLSLKRWFDVEFQKQKTTHQRKEVPKVIIPPSCYSDDDDD